MVVDKKNVVNIAFEIFMIGVVLVYLYPVANMVFLSLKSPQEVMSNPLWIPHKIYFTNYSVAWRTMSFPRALLNSLIITTSSALLIVVLSAMAAYPIARFNLRLNRIMYFVFLGVIMVPSQMVLIPIVKMFYTLRLVNTYASVILFYIASNCPFAIFLYTGFIRALPKELEEAATIDGCTPFASFFRIIFPLLKPVTATVIVLNIMFIWNDFLMPMVLLQNKDVRPLMPRVFDFFQEFVQEWNYAFAGSTLIVIPGLLMFLLLQKNFVKGMASGVGK